MRSLACELHLLIAVALEPYTFTMIRVFSQYVSIKSFLLIVIESFVIVMSLVLGARLRFWNDSAEFLIYAGSGSFLLQALTVLIVLETCCYYNDLYDLSVVRPRGEQFLCLAQALGAGCLLLGLLYYLIPGLLVGRGVLFIALILDNGGYKRAANRFGLGVAVNDT